MIDDHAGESGRICKADFLATMCDVGSVKYFCILDWTALLRNSRAVSVYFFVRI